MDIVKYKEITDFLQSPVQKRKWPATVLENHGKANFRKKVKPFFLQDGTLFYEHKKHGALRVVKPDEVKTILKACHVDPMSGHQGVNRTWDKVKTRYYWPSIMKDVEDMIHNCDPCQYQNRLTKASSTLHPIPVKNKAFSMLGMDLIGPFHETAKGNKYVIVLTDYLTKWPEVKAIPSKCADEIAAFVIETISRHGAPEVILTDNGREFCNQLNDTLCKKLGIEHRVTTPYHPQTNGLTERNNQTLCNALIKYVNEKQDDWDVYLHQIAFGMRTCRQSSTKATPFFLTYGREAVLPVQLDIPTELHTGQDILQDDFQEIVNDRVTAFAELLNVQSRVTEEIAKAQTKQKEYYDKKHNSEHFEIGDEILLKNKKKVNRKGDKMLSRWTGPYTIESYIGKGVYRLQNKKTKVNIKDMKKYCNPTRTSASVVKDAKAMKDLPQPKKNKKCPRRMKPHILPSSRKLKISRTSKYSARQYTSKRRPQATSKLHKNTLKSTTIIKQENIKSFVANLCDDTKQQIFNECSSHGITRPKTPHATSIAVKESPTLSLVMDVDKRFSDDLVKCQNELLSWYMTSNNKNLGMACSLDPFLLSSSLLTLAYNQNINPKDLLQTLKNIPMSATANSSSPCKMPKMSIKMNVVNVTLLRQDLCTLYNDQWLNDQVIHAYLGLLQSEYNAAHDHGCYILPCFLATKWENDQCDDWLFPQIPLEEFQHVLLPVCHQHHWFLLSADMSERTVTIYDSSPCQTRKERFCKHWMNFMADRGDNNTWTIGDDVSSKQMDGNSCGVFVLMNADAVLKDFAPMIMRQCHTKAYRKHILKRLLAVATQHNKTSCDLPYCSVLTHQFRQQCDRCCKWFHKKCLGIPDKQTVKSCVFCLGTLLKP